MVLMRRPEGILVQCDESIKTIIVKIDSELNDFIIEDLDDETLVIKAEKLPELKRRLNEVRILVLRAWLSLLMNRRC